MNRYLRIGIDMDSTLCNPFPEWKRYFDNAVHGHAEECLAVPPTWTYHAELCKVCFGEILDYDGAIEFAPLMPGARSAIHELSEIAYLYLVTHRNRGQERAVRRMLDNQGLTDRFDGVHVGWEKKSQTCGRWRFDCDIIVDDNPRVIADILASEEHISPVCFAQPYNLHVPVPRCNGWADVVDYVDHYFGHLRGRRLIADRVGVAGEAA